MKENVMDVLMFLFDNYLVMEDGGAYHDETTLTTELKEAGFESNNIAKAFNWLEDLAGMRPFDMISTEGKRHSFRIYTAEEKAKIDPDSRGFLLGLEQMGILDVPCREMIIDRAMAIDGAMIRLPQFKRIVGIILINRHDHEAVIAYLEDLIYDDVPTILH